MGYPHLWKPPIFIHINIINMMNYNMAGNMAHMAGNLHGLLTEAIAEQ